MMIALYAAKDHHGLSVAALCAPNIRFYVAQRADDLLGCCALADMGTYGEVKSMFVAPAARGAGVARLLLDRIIAEAETRGLPLLRLETGVGLDAAIALYERAGFVRRAPFGAYSDSPASIFMEKPLAAQIGVQS